jgi:hypothetical protein
METSIDNPSLDELAHHGIMGMHWGHHKGEISASIEKAHANLKSQEKILRKETERYNRAGSTYASASDQKRFDSAMREYDYARTDLKSAKILDKINSSPKSKSQLKVESKYKEKGMSNDEASVAAYKHIKTRNLLIAVGATTVVAGGAYLAYKYHDDRVDKIIKSGTKLSNISAENTKDIRDAFYSTRVGEKGKILDKIDNSKYKGIFARNISGFGKTPYDKEIHVLKDIKMVSPENSRKTIASLIKTDPDYHEKLKSYILYQTGDYVDSWPGLDKVRKRAVDDIVDGKVTKDVYKIVNMAMADHRPNAESITEPFKKALSKDGYNAIKDITDNQLSGFRTFNPIITFNSKGLVDVVGVKEVTEDIIKKSEKLAYGHLHTVENVKAGGQLAGIILGFTGINTGVKALGKQSLTRETLNYRKDNPNTKLSNTEITRMLERSR